MKKKYIKPATKNISLHTDHLLGTVSTKNTQGVVSSMLSRENSSAWDDEEEEEIEDSMWK